MGNDPTKINERWWRNVCALFAASVMVLAPGFDVGAATAPTQVADPCPLAFPVAELTPGLVGSGLTVERGTVADPFTATVLGVVDEAIAPGVDLIVVEVDSPAIQRAGGVWLGMSGSPVYAEDGRLIGAVAYLLAEGGTNIAGLTPAADMLALLNRSTPTPSPPVKVDLPAAIERELVAPGAATMVEASAGMRPLPIPLGVSGVNPAHFATVAERLEERLPWTRVYSAGAAAAGAAASQEEIFPGSNFAAAISTGDASAIGVGTTTAVCSVGDTELALAFGHPFDFLGTTAMSAHPADAVVVQPDRRAPFKVANPGGVVGTVDQDRLAGIRGVLGVTPPAISVTSTLTSSDDGATRSGSTQLNVPRFVGEVAAVHLLNNLDRVIDRVGEGTSNLRWVISGNRASGAPFTVDVRNRYADNFDVTDVSIDEVFVQLSRLQANEFEEARITGVQFTGSVSSVFTRYSLGSVLLRRPDGTLSPLPTDRPIQVVAGSRLNLRVVLVPYRNLSPPRNVDLSVLVPPDTAGGSASLDVIGGRGFFDEPEAPESFDALLAQLQGTIPNDALTARLRIENEGPSGPVTRQTSARQLLDQVVVGEKSFTVQVIAPRRARPAVVDGNVWNLRSTLSGGPATTTFTFGLPTDRKLMGDWDGNGTLTPAVYRNGTWLFRPSGTSAPAAFTFGQQFDIPVVGDWDGDGRDGIGIYRAGRWQLRNTLSSGPPDLDFTFGNSTQQPAAGDWNGDGIDTIGTFRSGTWAQRDSNSAGVPSRVFTFGAAGDVPLIGEWDLDGRDEIGVYRAGRWLLRNTLTPGPPSLAFTYGGSRSRPVVWN